MEAKGIVKGLVLGAILFRAMLPLIGYSAVPGTINYQGYLTDSLGTPISATVPIVFSLYSGAIGGNALWIETQNVVVASGIYSVNLGSVNPITLPFEAQYYLGVKVGTDPEMTPRKALTSVGYAFRATAADTATSATTALSATTATSAVTATSAGTATHFSGTLSGDVTGTQNVTTVGRIQGYAVSSAAPAANHVLRHDGTTWSPSVVSLTTDVSGVLPILSGGTGSNTKNFVDLSTVQTVAGAKTFSNPILSTVDTGTAPFQVNSTTMVMNLNAEMVGGQRLAELDTVYQKKY